MAALARAGLGAAAVVRALPLGARVVEAVAEARERAAARARAAPAALARAAASGAPSRVRGAPAPARGSLAGEGRGGVVYFPSCLTRIVGPLPGENGPAPARAMREVLRWAGYSVRVPEGASGLCCGMAFASKGYTDGRARGGARAPPRRSGARRAADGCRS